MTPSVRGKYDGRGINELRRVRQFYERYAKFKQLVIDLSLDKNTLGDAIRTKL